MGFSISTCLPAAKSSDCRVAFGIGMAEEDRVDISAQQVVEGADVPGDSKAFGDIGRLVGRQVADNGNGKFLVECQQVG